MTEPPVRPASFRVSRGSNDRLIVRFNFRPELVDIVRMIPGRRWHSRQGVWTVPDTPAARAALGWDDGDAKSEPEAGSAPTVEQGAGRPAPHATGTGADAESHHPAEPTHPRHGELSAYAPAHQPPESPHPAESWTHDDVLGALAEEIQLRRYSPRTRKAYTHHARAFLRFVSLPPVTLDGSHARAYLLTLSADDAYSVAYHAQAASALRFLFQNVLRRTPAVGQLPRPRREKKLPAVLDRRDALSLVESLDNPKHRALLMVLYSAGLRVSEVVRLRVEDLDQARMTIRVRGGKGRKDRYTLLSARALEAVRAYMVEFQPTTWLFPGARPSKPLGIRSAQRVVERARQHASIDAPATAHTLRHSFATHLLESGTDIRYIQELLGHASLRTTEIYTHVSKRDIARIRSPLDEPVQDDG